MEFSKPDILQISIHFSVHDVIFCGVDVQHFLAKCHTCHCGSVGGPHLSQSQPLLLVCSFYYIYIYIYIYFSHVAAGRVTQPVLSPVGYLCPIVFV